MIRRFEIAFIAVTMQFSIAAWAATTAKGWYEENCDDSTIHLGKVEGMSDHQELVLTLDSHGMPLASWEGYPVKVQAKRCSDDGQCEYIAQAKIQISRTRAGGREIFGRYSADFPYGAHYEGEFAAKYRKPKHMPICE